MSHHLSPREVDDALHIVKQHHGCASEVATFVCAHREQNMSGGAEDARVDYTLFIEHGRKKLPAYVTAEATTIEETRRMSKLAAE